MWDNVSPIEWRWGGYTDTMSNFRSGLEWGKGFQEPSVESDVDFRSTQKKKMAGSHLTHRCPGCQLDVGIKHCPYVSLLQGIKQE